MAFEGNELVPERFVGCFERPSCLMYGNYLNCLWSLSWKKSLPTTRKRSNARQRNCGWTMLRQGNRPTAKQRRRMARRGSGNNAANVCTNRKKPGGVAEHKAKGSQADSASSKCRMYLQMAPLPGQVAPFDARWKTDVCGRIRLATTKRGTRSQLLR